MSNANPDEVYNIVQPCGLGNKRSVTLIRMSQEFLNKSWTEPKELYGIGEYANDSWRIFIKNEMISPKDKELRKYMQWKRELQEGPLKNF